MNDLVNPPKAPPRTLLFVREVVDTGIDNAVLHPAVVARLNECTDGWMDGFWPRTGRDGTIIICSSPRIILQHSFCNVTVCSRICLILSTVH